jgi:TetR/AcrR family transcriptional regulator, transcriptional repressor for nem operon
MLHESGYAATGIQEIVDAAKVPKGSFYNHFESKETFAKEVVDAYFGMVLPELTALLSDERIPLCDRLRTYFEERTRRFRSSGYLRGCMLGNMILEVALQSPSIRERLAAHLNTWSGLFEACIDHAQKSGAIQNNMPAPQLADFLLNSWEGAMLRMRIDKTDVPLNDFIEVVWGSILV